MDGGVAVVAILVVGQQPRRLLAGQRHVRGIAEAVAVVIGVPAVEIVHIGIVVVGQAIAVLVHVVRVADLLRAGIHSRVAVVAVRIVVGVAFGQLAGHAAGVGIAVAVAVRVRVPGRAGGGVQRVVLVVDQVVAIIVRIVADLAGRRMDGGVAVVAVLVVGDKVGKDSVARIPAGQGVSVAIPVSIGVPGGGVGRVVLVVLPVAVVIHTVAALLGSRKDLRVAVIAVAGLRCGAAGRLAGEHAVPLIAIAIPVGVEVVGLAVGRILIDLIVAVVVQTVAYLLCVRVDRGMGVVAVHGSGVAVAVVVDLAWIRLAASVDGHGCEEGVDSPAAHVVLRFMRLSIRCRPVEE